MIAKAVLHDVISTDPSRVGKPAQPKPIPLNAARLIDRPRRLKDMAELRQRPRIAAQRRVRRLRLNKGRLPQNRQAGKPRHIRDRCCLHPRKGARIARKALSTGNLRWQITC